MTGSWIYTCYQRSMISIKTDSSFEINLLSDKENSGGFGVCLEITSASSSSLRLSCGKSRWSTTSYKPTDRETSLTESITPSGDESSQPSSGNESNQPTSDRGSNQTTSASESNQQTTPTSKNDNSMSAIIGGAVGGLIVIIIIIIIIVICVIHKRRKDKSYKSPETLETDAHPYQNIPDNRSGDITHQPKQNNELVNQENDPYNIIDNDIIKPSNGNQGVEYLENDLYISSDDVTNDVVVDDKLKPSNGNQGMEYLENNLYISSDDITDDVTDNVVVNDKLKSKLPVVAKYAQVNKSNRTHELEI
ncbi:uncharacterized protein LOC126828620 [Patella vulgata]|uniref:uncharacterized protein LOC126828620 n=1 Tax=Patella vulgata TaxID=6465 RepID=UPI0024A98DFD|nr:uncharacterized protein LOC126828620 [Patella vulgata]